MRNEEYAYLETDDHCAICGIGDRRNLTIHHIDENRSNNNYENLIVLCHNCHHRYHENKGLSDDDIKRRKKNLIARTLDHYGVNALKIAARQGGVMARPFLVFHLVDLGLLEEKNVMASIGRRQFREHHDSYV